MHCLRHFRKHFWLQTCVFSPLQLCTNVAEYRILPHLTVMAFDGWNQRTRCNWWELSQDQILECLWILCLNLVQFLSIHRRSDFFVSVSAVESLWHKTPTCAFHAWMIGLVFEADLFLDEHCCKNNDETPRTYFGAAKWENDGVPIFAKHAHKRGNVPHRKAIRHGLRIGAQEKLSS